ncbi:MAG: hypothetical protein OXG79_12625 [Chloroflexi bacterium]|nr:hypothetical protein [Chloroflexota bacterium]
MASKRHPTRKCTSHLWGDWEPTDAGHRRTCILAGAEYDHVHCDAEQLRETDADGNDVLIGTFKTPDTWSGREQGWPLFEVTINRPATYVDLHPIRTKVYASSPEFAEHLAVNEAVRLGLVYIAQTAKCSTRQAAA